MVDGWEFLILTILMVCIFNHRMVDGWEFLILPILMVYIFNHGRANECYTLLSCFLSSINKNRKTKDFHIVISEEHYQTECHVYKHEVMVMRFQKMSKRN